MWWRDLANRYAHGEPMPWHKAVLWRCEACGCRLFDVLFWDEFPDYQLTELNSRSPMIYKFLLRCAECGAVEINICESFPFREG